MSLYELNFEFSSHSILLSWTPKFPYIHHKTQIITWIGFKFSENENWLLKFTLMVIRDVNDNDDHAEDGVEKDIEAKKALQQILWKVATCLYFASALNAEKQICCCCCQIWFVPDEMLICGRDKSNFENNRTSEPGFDKKKGRIREFRNKDSQYLASKLWD